MIMRKVFLFLIFALINLKAVSQTYDSYPFCPPGAVWVHKLSAPWDQFYRVSTYSNDTIILGYQCKKIIQKFIILYLPDPSHIDTIRVEDIGKRRNIFWRESNDSVFIFHNNQFELLYDFNPNISDELIMNRRNNANPVCDTIQFPELLWDDTLKVIAINPNFNLNNVFYKHISFNAIDRWSYGPVIAKIGGISSLTPCQGYFSYPITSGGLDETCVQYEECGSFYAYYDPLRGYVGNMNNIIENTFNLVVSVQEINSINNHQFIIYPNPTENTLSVLGVENGEMYEYSIIDLFGRLMDHKKDSDLKNISVSNLNSGTYFIKITSKKYSQTIKFERK